MVARIALLLAFVGMAMAGEVSDLVDGCGKQESHRVHRVKFYYKFWYSL